MSKTNPSMSSSVFGARFGHTFGWIAKKCCTCQQNKGAGPTGVWASRLGSFAPTFFLLDFFTKKHRFVYEIGRDGEKARMRP